jgi:two-component system response regulator TctD
MIKMDSNGRKTLVIEDNFFNQQLLLKILSKIGVAADVAGSLEEARVRLSTNSYDILLLDLNLPDGLGTEFAAEVKLQRKETRIYLITANILIDPNELKAVDALLPKPVLLDDIRKIFSD